MITNSPDILSLSIYLLVSQQLEIVIRPMFVLTKDGANRNIIMGIITENMCYINMLYSELGPSALFGFWFFVYAKPGTIPSILGFGWLVLIVSLEPSSFFDRSRNLSNRRTSFGTSQRRFWQSFIFVSQVQFDCFCLSFRSIWQDSCIFNFLNFGCFAGTKINWGSTRN